VLERLRGFAAALEAPRVRPLVVAGLVLALLLGTAASFAIAERLKLERSPVTAPRIPRVIGPECGCDTAVARMTVRLRRAAVVGASIVDGKQQTVRTLSAPERRPAGQLAFEWNGRNDAGELVRDGSYRLRLAVTNEDRVITIPNPIRVDTRPPRIRLLDATPTVISPDGDGYRDGIRFRYAGNEPAAPAVEVDGAVVARGRVRPPGAARLRWGGKVDGKPLAPGEYGLRLFLEDPAGNRSRPAPVVTLTVRYVALDAVPARVAPRQPLRFYVDADAPRVRIAVRARGGRVLLRRTVASGRVRLPLRLSPGRYVLVARVGNHRDRVPFQVVRR
jgi:hypothetical protein